MSLKMPKLTRFFFSLEMKANIKITCNKIRWRKMELLFKISYTQKYFAIMTKSLWHYRNREGLKPYIKLWSNVICSFTWDFMCHHNHQTEDSSDDCNRTDNTESFWRCPWCNGYRHRKWTRQHEFKSWMRLIAFHIALIPWGKVWIQIFSLQLWVNSRAD